MLVNRATTTSNSITQTACSECGSPMDLTRIEPDKPGHDLRTFECPQCQHSETIVVQFKSA